MVTENTHGTVLPRPIEAEMRSSYIDYSMSVIVGRALPDVRDGLKPVHRRILYAMGDMGLTPDKAYRKSALVVGDAMGKYHPHGDSAIYDTLVRMAQDFSLRYPLIDGQGNFGSIDGDSAAAMRYTEARLSRLAVELLEDIDEETVDFVDNYDASRKEPSVLPSKIPNLLLNGSAGIAVGMATNVPPHQLGEVVDGIRALIANPDVTAAELLQFIPGPDFPTGGIIYGRQGIVDAYTTGRGIIKVRAKADIEETEKHGNRIIVTEIPYMVNKANLQQAIVELIREKKIEGIRDIRDESNHEGMRLIFELKRDANPEVVLNNLYKHSQLESSFGILNLAVVNGEPVVLTLKGMMQQYLDHRVDVVTRRTRFRLKKAEARRHIVEGLLRTVDQVDRVIELIRASRDAAEARERLMGIDFAEARIAVPGHEPLFIPAGRMSEEQVKAILEMRLSKLTGLEIESLGGELTELRASIRRFNEILADRAEVLKIIDAELAEMKEKYNDKRRTEIRADAGEINMEDLIPDEHVVISITNDGYIKRIPLDAYRTQKRGGKGLQGMATKEEDFVVDLFTTTTHRYVLFFTNVGKVYWLKGWQIPEGTRQSKGKAIVNLLEGLEKGERIQAAIPVKEFKEDHYLFFATRKGTVKKTSLAEYSRPRSTGIIAMGIEEGDELIGVGITNGDDEIVLAKANGQSIRFHEADVRSMGRPAFGVRGVTLENGDEVVSLAVIQNKAGQLLTITENGYGKRTPVEEYRLQGRGGQGIITIQTNMRNGRVVAVKEVTPEDEVIVTSTKGMIIRIPVATVSEMGRNTQGTRIMRLEESDKVMAVAVLVREALEEAALEAAARAEAEAAAAPPTLPEGTDPVVLVHR
ncbi:MAG TPA: DNA gyrase subunit A, partial [Candidatus Thermoplasmatota archaeon]|nr:DNA gyrase subunit A [Candidatus Thermoplasmatota archaeon]